MLGETCLAVRVDASTPGARLRLVDAVEGTAQDLRDWRQRKFFAGSQVVLVLGTAERQIITIDRPDVQDDELQQAVRWPLAEAMELEAEELLTTAQPLPPINAALKPQLLAIAARVAVARAHIATLKSAGIALRSIDIVDSALRGMALLQGSDNNGSVVLAFVGGDICIGLLWHGEFCALRTLALPVRVPRDSGEFEEQLALHIQRTTDHFERQATQLAVRHVLASMPSLGDATRESVRSALPLAPRMFELDAHFDMSGVTRERCEGHNELSALACVAAARLIDAGHWDASANAPPAQDAAASIAAHAVASASARSASDNGMRTEPHLVDVE